jgi:DNA-binding NtrC family response regulator
LITGESGTGKDVVARAIHECSRHRRGPFVPVNCGAIAAALMESEFFGHERGSFTGAHRRHVGYFERAHRGTLFLDEITEMPLELQVKLLRVLEGGSFVRVGGEAPIAVDVRVLAASNRNVVTALSQGTLREDLYYRLRVFELELPPLRDRADDVAPLVSHFLAQLELGEGMQKDITPDALRVLESYPWPGNVRELRNVVHAAFLLAGPTIDVDALPDQVLSGRAPVSRWGDDSAIRVAVGTPLADVERRLIVATLRQCDGHKRKAAELLGISLKTLYNRVHEYGAASAPWSRLTSGMPWSSAGDADGAPAAARGRG